MIRRILRYSLLCTLAVCFGLLLTGCAGVSSGSSGSGGQAKVAKVTVAPLSAQILDGASQQFSAAAFDSSGNLISGVNFTWSSDAPSVATVNGSGLATGISAGTANITATAQSIPGSAKLTSGSGGQAKVAKVTVAPLSAQILDGASQQFSAAAFDSSGNLISGVSFTWSSDAPSVATVNSSGLATGISAGTANITATAQSIPGSAKLTSESVAHADFFVAPNGLDSWSGTLPAPNSANSDGPFASLAKAQIAIRNLAKTNPKRPLSVMVRAGTYYLPLSPTNPGTLNFTSADSGNSGMPITWQNYPDETAILSGGVPVGAGVLHWTNVSGNLWQAQIPSKGQVFESLFYNGERRLRARVQSSAGVGYYMNNGACYSTVTGQTVSLANCNLGTFLRIAAEVPPGNTGCPSVSDGTQSKCLDRFKYDPSDPITRWVNLNGIYTGDPSKPCQADSSNPYPAGDIELTLFDAWTVDVMRVNCVDTTNHIIYLTGPTKGAANQYNIFGPGAGHRYIVENAVDAFQQGQQTGQTGLWFLDRSTAPWSLSYLADSGENPNQDIVVIPQVQPASATGGSIVSATQLSYVTFQGIVFETDNFVPPTAGFSNDENGENTLPAAIDCESCQYVTFDGIAVRHTSASGLQIASLAGHSGPPAANDVVQNSAFYDLGDSGIHIGHSPQGNDRAASVVQSVTVQNNIIQGYGRVFPDGEGLAQGNGNNILYQHNDINDGYHAGISICEQGCPGENGSDIVSQFNHIWNIMQGITSDGGTLYYNVGSSQRSGTGNKILNNLVHDVSDSSVIDRGILGTGYGGHGIYLDAQSAGVSVENNVVYRVSADILFMTQGPANSDPPDTFSNNILAYGRKSMFTEAWGWPQNCGSSTRVNLVSNIMYFDQSDSTAFYVIQGCADSCGMAFNQYQNFQRNLYWRTDGQFATYKKAFHVLTTPPPPGQANSCAQPLNPSADWTFFDFPTWQNGHPMVNGIPLSMNEDSEGSVSLDPGFGNTGQATDFLLSQSPVSGFDYSQTNNTINLAGRSNPLIKAPTVPPTFPTYYYTTF